MFIYGVIDDHYQKNAHFSKLKLFFSMRSIKLSTVIAEMFRLIVIGVPVILAKKTLILSLHQIYTAET